jgi:predicted nucleic acid-binding protein
MPSFLPDTSCMVAAVCGWHVHHASASLDVKRRLGAGESLVLAAPTLVEAYAVLSRLPPPHRLSPADGWLLIRTSFVDHASDVVALDADAIRRLLAELAARGVAGGGVYDAHIVGCALRARVNAILTFNARQLRLVAPADLTVIVPS